MQLFVSHDIICCCLLTHIASILRQKTTECHVKKYCVAYLDSIGSFAYTREVLFDLERK